MDTAEAIASRPQTRPTDERPPSVYLVGRGQHQSQLRSLQVEIIGDQWKGFTPRIRIAGKWLERAGFKPGTRVFVACLAQGLIELRSQSGGANAVSCELPNPLENPS